MSISFSLFASVLSCIIPISRNINHVNYGFLMKDFLDGKKILSHCMTEPNTGSNAFSLQTNFTKKVLNGEKVFVSNATAADYFLVYAVTNKEALIPRKISCLLVQKSNLLIVEEINKNLLEHSDYCKVFFNKMIINEPIFIGQRDKGAKLFIETMAIERVGLSAMHVGLIKALRVYVVALVKSQKNQPQFIKFLLADIYILEESSRLMYQKSAIKINQNKFTETIHSMAKYYCSTNLVQVGKYVNKILNYYNIREDWIEKILNDSVCSLTYSGTSNIQKSIISNKL